MVAHRGNRRYATTYGELAELAGRSAAELDRRGIAPGDRVVLWGENSAEWIGVFFGCLLRGVIAVPLDAAGSSEFANRVVTDVSPKLIVGDRGLLASLKNDVPQLVVLRDKRAVAARADIHGKRFRRMDRRHFRSSLPLAQPQSPRELFSRTAMCLRVCSLSRTRSPST